MGHSTEFWTGFQAWFRGCKAKLPTEIRAKGGRANWRFQLEISTTFCGAHAVPKGSTEERQTELIVNDILPELKRLQENGTLKTVENIDVFCEKGVFELESRYV